MLDAVLAAHGAAVIALLAAFHKWGDRAEHFEKSLTGTENTLAVLRREIAFSLGLRLKPVFDNPVSIIDIGILDASGNPIRDIRVSPVGSEGYKEALNEFVLSHVAQMSSYELMTSAKSKWCRWTKYLSWTLFWAVIFEACILVAMFIWANPLHHPIADSGCAWSFLPTAMFALGYFGEMAMIMRWHDVIMDVRKTYDSN